MLMRMANETGEAAGEKDKNGRGVSLKARRHMAWLFCLAQGVATGITGLYDPGPG